MEDGTRAIALSGATPLIALPAVAIDTETTGLDARKARIVQFGAVAMRGDTVLRDRTLGLLVDPGQPIPPETTAIHGIADPDVAGSPQFAEAWVRVQRFIGGRLVLGYSIGFDLAVLEGECRRADLPWQRPRALCVRLLATVANPNLPGYSLDMIASWLGVRIDGRHSAIGDALAAADIFAALLPVLRARNIRTLGEAEIACLGLSQDLEAGHRAGWAEPVSRPQAPAFGAVDPFAYRNRVGDLMSHPPVVVRADTGLGDVLDIMVERRLGSVLVSENGAANLSVDQYGIVTERDVMRRLAADRDGFLARTAGQIMSRPLASVRARAFAYRAIGRMERLGIRHLAVRDERNTLVGVVSARDMLRLRAGSAIRLDDTIEQAGSASDLAAAWAMLPAVVAALQGEEIDPRSVSEIISEELRSMTRRAAALAERDMAAAGLGAPPCGYALLVLGSGGRGESLMAPDQDNAIVFEEGEPGGPEDSWFAELGTRISAMLDAAGIDTCKGGVMAREAGFRGSLDTWFARIEDWLGRSRPQDLLNVDIFYDMRAVHGDLALADRLHRHAGERAAANPVFAKLLGEQVAPGNPFTLFGGLQLDEGRIDLKLNGLFPIVATARTLALRHGISEVNTRARLEALIVRGIGGEQDLRAMLEGQVLLIGLLLDQQARDIHAGIKVSNRVELSAMSRDAQSELKALVKRLQGAPQLIRDLMF